jgi:PAS domain S-box-containing protein
MNELTYTTIQENNFPNPTTNSDPSYVENKEKSNSTTASEIYEGLFQNAFHAMNIETSDGLVLKFNEKFCKLFGYSLSEMAQVENSGLFETEETAYVDFLDQRIDKGIAKGEITGIKKSGKRFSCRITSVIYQSDLGDKRVMNMLVDISENLLDRWNFGG